MSERHPALDVVDGAFRSPAEVAALAEGFIDRSLPKERWTHAAHFTAAAYIARERADLDVDRDFPTFIRAYNRAWADPTAPFGYHETLTRFYLAAIKGFLSGVPKGEPIDSVCNRLLATPVTARGFPLRYYSPERLFSEEARARFVEPDLAPLDF